MLKQWRTFCNIAQDLASHWDLNSRLPAHEAVEARAIFIKFKLSVSPFSIHYDYRMKKLAQTLVNNTHSKISYYYYCKSIVIKMNIILNKCLNSDKNVVNFFLYYFTYQKCSYRKLKIAEVCFKTYEKLKAYLVLPLSTDYYLNVVRVFVTQ